MIKYYHVPSQRKTIAVLSDCELDAVRKIAKVLNQSKSLCFNPDKYLMNGSYRAVVVCSPEDEYDPKIGEAIAKSKLLNRYYEQLDNKLEAFYFDMQNIIDNLYDCMLL